MMTMKAKLLVALIVLSVVGVGVWRFWDKIAPAPKSNIPSLNVKDMNAKLNEMNTPKQGVAVNPIKNVFSKLLAGTNAPAIIDANSKIPDIQGISGYEKAKYNGKMLVRFPINVWPGWAPIIMANGGMAPNAESLFFKKYGFYVELSLVDDPVKARNLFASGYTHVLWGTLDMMALFAPALCQDSRTVPVIPMQIDYSAGGDGAVGRNGVKSMNDFRMKNGIKRKVVIAQNSPSHYFFMSMLLNSQIDPSEIDFIWTADAPSAAKLFVQDNSVDAFVGWSPDIYTVADQVPGTFMVVNSSSANHVIADVFAFRNDFYKDNPQVVKQIVECILEGTEMVRKDPKKAAQLLSDAYGLPIEDTTGMIGSDGGIATGDAHLTNFRENHNFFLNPNNPYGFEAIWNRASMIYKAIGAIDNPVDSSKVKDGSIILGLSDKFKDSTDLSQPNFDPNMVFKALESDENQILTAPVMILFASGSWKVMTETNNYAMNPKDENKIVDQRNMERNANNASNIQKIVEIAANFGNAYILIEGNTDASMRGLVPSDSVKKLSQERAESVKSYLVSTYTNLFSPNKFKVVGNGWDNPLPNCTNPNDPDNNRRNRRTEIKVFPLEN